VTRANGFQAGRVEKAEQDLGQSGIAPLPPAALRQRAAAAYLGVSVEFLQGLPVQPLRIRGHGRRGKVVVLYLVRELDAWLAIEAEGRERQIQTRRTG
jgi:hypothetical protein